MTKCTNVGSELRFSDLYKDEGSCVETNEPIPAIKYVRAPVENMAYVYLLDMAWYADHKDPKTGKSHNSDVKFNYGTIITNVTKRTAGVGYEFDFDGVRYQCTYGWAFAEYTPENIKRIEAYNNLTKIYKELGTMVDAFRNKIDRLV